MCEVEVYACGGKTKKKRSKKKKKSACKRAGTTKSVGGNGGGWVRSQCRTGKYINHWKLRTGTRLCDNDRHH